MAGPKKLIAMCVIDEKSENYLSMFDKLEEEMEVRDPITAQAKGKKTDPYLMILAIFLFHIQGSEVI